MPAALSETIVTGTVLTEFGKPATGSIRAQLSAPLSNGASPVYGVTPIIKRFDANGAFSLNLVANNEAQADPQGTTWNITISIDGLGPPWTFSVVVPYITAVSIDLFSLPGAQR